MVGNLILALISKFYQTGKLQKSMKSLYKNKQPIIRI